MSCDGTWQLHLSGKSMLRAVASSERNDSPSLLFWTVMLCVSSTRNDAIPLAKQIGSLHGWGGKGDLGITS